MPTLKYDFSIVGLNAVNRALANLERRLAMHNARLSRITGDGAVTGGRGGRGGRGGPYRAAPAYALKEVAAQKAAHRQLLAGEASFQRQLSQLRSRERQREAASLRQFNQQQLRQRMRYEGRQNRSRGSILGSGLRGGRSVVSAFRSAGHLAGGALAMGGSFAIADAVSREKKLNAQAQQLAIQAFGTPSVKGRSVKSLKRQALDVARTQSMLSGQTPETIIGAMYEFQSKTGQFDIGAQMAEYMTELSDATGAAMEDVGTTAGQVFISAMEQIAPDKIPKGMTKAQVAMRQTMTIMDAMAGQAKVGSIEMRDLAQQMGKLMSATGPFGGDVTAVASALGVMAQKGVAGGAKGPAEAMTALMRFSSDVMKRGSAERGVYKKLGIDPFIYEGKGKERKAVALRTPKELIKQMVSATKGDIRYINQLLGARGVKVFAPSAMRYTAAGGGEKGLKAIDQQFAEIEQQAMDTQMRRQLASERREESDRQLNKVVNDFKDKVGQKLLPELTKLIPQMSKMVPLITDVVGFFAENPLKGLGAVILTKVGADIMGAAIGAGIKKLLLGQVGAGLAAKAGAGAATPGATTAATAGGLSLSTLGLGGLGMGASAIFGMIGKELGASAGDVEANIMGLTGTGKKLLTGGKQLLGGALGMLGGPLNPQTIADVASSLIPATLKEVEPWMKKQVGATEGIEKWGGMLPGVGEIKGINLPGFGEGSNIPLLKEKISSLFGGAEESNRKLQESGSQVSESFAAMSKSAKEAADSLSSIASLSGGLNLTSTPSGTSPTSPRTK